MAGNHSLTAVIGGLVGADKSEREQADVVQSTDAFASSHQLGFKREGSLGGCRAGVSFSSTSRLSGRGKGMSLLESIRLGSAGDWEC